jgi:hypothetical protein
MDYERLFTLADAARSRRKIAGADVVFLRDKVPAELKAFPNVRWPKTVKHPGGFSISGAPVGTFSRSALLLAGQKAFGNRYSNAPFYERVESDLAMRIMRSHFHGDAPKGAFCCKQCTLAVLPVLEANAIRYFECRPLARDVRRMIHAGEWRFATPPNARMLDWALAG